MNGVSFSVPTVVSSGAIIAHYNLKPPGEPPYYGSSGCMLTVEQEFGHLACGTYADRFSDSRKKFCSAEMPVATVMIMRHMHIDKYGL